MTPSSWDHEVRVAFETVLDILDAEGREPDRYEEDCLLHALGYLACEIYDLAAIEIANFYTGPMPTSSKMRYDFTNRPPKFTKSMLRKGIASLRALAR